MRRTAFWLLLPWFGLFFAAASRLQASSPSKPAQSASSQPTAQSAPAHRRIDPALYHPSALTAKAPDVYEVKFTTTKGEFVVQVTRAWAPVGADRFYNLVRHHYFDDNSFFRVVPGFVIQFGMSPSPSVNKAWDKATLKDDPVVQSNTPGSLTFATSGPSSRTTQVFINLGNNSSLDSLGFAPFGRVTSGMEVVSQIYSGYGDLPEMGGQGPSESRIETEGKPYLDKNFPKLDTIITATIISPTPAPASRPAAGKAGASKASSPNQ
jgi:peptidyl-prolyl cis-trans isomerase A (cyclophilin A)